MNDLLRTVSFGLATSAFEEYGADSPEFMGPATVWAYTLPEFGGNVAEAERAIQEEHRIQSESLQRRTATRGSALSAMLYG